MKPRENKPSTLLCSNRGRVKELGEIGTAFLRLGCISFGGPVAHIGFLREEFVSRRQWLKDSDFSDLVALCQFLPGPGSSQLVFALGMQRAGIFGALLASLCFTMPSVVLMIAFAYGVSAIGGLEEAGWLHGLKLAAVAVVAQAVWGMARRLCFDWTTHLLALAAAAVVLAVPGTIGQLGVIIAGAAIGWVRYRAAESSPAPNDNALTRNHLWAVGALVIFFGLLIFLPIVARATGKMEIRYFDSFYRAGSLVFGGGHVVLPLLRAELVPPGWISDNAFLAGYGAAQAVPGPLFTFAAYLGTIINTGPHAWEGGLWCALAIFLPAWLLIGGTLPFWHLIRGKAWARAAMVGANAAVVGVLLAALYNPVWKQGITDVKDVGLAVSALALLEVFHFPPWLVVGLAAAAGQWLL